MNFTSQQLSGLCSGLQFESQHTSLVRVSLNKLIHLLFAIQVTVKQEDQCGGGESD